MNKSLRRRTCLVVTLVLGFSMAAWAEDGRVKRDGFDLCYKTEGTGTPVVLISGGPGFDVDYSFSYSKVLRRS